MSTEIAQQQAQQAPFMKGATMPAATNVGAVAIEQERAIAEAQGQLTLAKRFPRDLHKAHAELMESCSMRSFAEAAFYSVPRGGQSISGPSIRLAEEIARVYGNFQYGHRELSRSDGKSEVEVYAWDMENNNYSKRQITVLHVIDTKNGPRKLTDQADIDNRIANVASKQIRGRILALMPKWLVADAIEKCKATLVGQSDEPISARVRKMVQAFAKFAVNQDHIETYLGHSLDDITIDELVDLTGVYNALREGAKPSEFFGAKEAEERDEKKAAINSAIAGAAAPKPAPQPQAAQPQAANTAAPKSAGSRAAAKPQPQKAPEPAPAPEQEHEPDVEDDDPQEQEPQADNPAGGAPNPLF